MVDFATLKSNRSKSIESLTEELNKINTKYQNDDDKYWQPTVDKAGNGQAIIRFLPPPGDEKAPFIRYWEHGFKGPGGWYIEKSLTTLGENDPCAEHNNTLWESGRESDKKIARDQKRKLYYVSNIYVVSDPANPENDGKVFLFKYGKKIFDKINDLMNPAFEGDEKINPFDLWDGCNFRLRIRKVEGYRNYEKSDFAGKTPLLEDDDEMKVVWESEHPLQPIIAPDKFKTYDALKARLDKVLKINTATKSDNSDSKPDSSSKFKSTKSSSPPWESSNPEDDEDDSEDTTNFFKKLRDGDDED